MIKIITSLTLAGLFASTGTFAMYAHKSSGGVRHSSSAFHGTMQEGSGAEPAGETGHAGMQHGSSSMDGHFKHSVMTDDVHSEFQIMELASMNMTDPDGKTHHVMVTFTREDQKIEKLAGKVKIIAPSGKEQIADLKDNGGGNFAANFTIDEDGKWGVI